MSMYDVHCHLDYSSLVNRLGNICNSSVKGVLSSGIELSSWEKNIALAKKYPFNVSLGLHPFFVKDKYPEVDMLRGYLEQEHVVAVGEIGLDYYNEYAESKDLQQEIFAEQLLLANQLGLPVIIHCRKAYDDLYRILKQFDLPALVFHCFGGSEQDMQKLLEFNSFFTFGFPITNENNKKHKRLIKLVPQARLLLETDSPFLKPRGKWESTEEYSDPRDIKVVYESAAKILDIEMSDLKDQVERNVKTIWKDFRELSS